MSRTFSRLGLGLIGLLAVMLVGGGVEAAQPAEAKRPASGSKAQSPTNRQSPASKEAGKLLPASSQVTPTANASRPSLALAPAIVMVHGKPGQSTRQKLRLGNQTQREFTFELEAKDVVVKDGKRTFVQAGEIPGSIAATAVFSPNSVTIKPGEVAEVQATFTAPPGTPVRAVVALFRGTNTIPSGTQGAMMTASLGTLITFTLSEDVQVKAEQIEISPQSGTANLVIAQRLANLGSEPVLPKGMAAVLNEKGVLVGKVAFPAKRLLPKEQLQFQADYPSELRPGRYRALASFQYAGKTLTNAVDFIVP